MTMSLKAARVDAGLTQDAVCSELDMNKNTLIGYEKYRRFPDINTAKAMAALYGRSVDDIRWTAE
jgi:DNA-binding XRE family transcriptional regulator